MSLTLMRGMVRSLVGVSALTGSPDRVTVRVTVQRRAVDLRGEQSRGGEARRVTETPAVQRGAGAELAEARARRDPLERPDHLGVTHGVGQRVEAVGVNPHVRIGD